MIMPCMNSMSAGNGALGGIRTVSSVRNLPGRPGAPGCTMGADCCADDAMALSKKSEAVRDRLQRAMHYYTLRVVSQSTEAVPSGSGPGTSAAVRLEAACWPGWPLMRVRSRVLDRPRYSKRLVPTWEVDGSARARPWCRPTSARNSGGLLRDLGEICENWTV